MSDSASPGARIDDTSLSLCDLRRRTGKPLLHSVIKLYKAYGTSNDKSIEFWENLKCFSPVDFDTERRTSECSPSNKIPLKLHSPRNGYVALSYRWEPSECESTKTGKYTIGSEVKKQLDVRDIVLDRTFRFIRYRQARGVVLPLWIDQLSINQEAIGHMETLAKELAMQSMDLVYKECTYAVGYLWAQLQTQVEMIRLSDLLSGRIVRPKLVEGNPVLANGVKKDVVHEVLDVLTKITNDTWWTRAWIFQEDYLASRKMWLLIRHSHKLRKLRTHNKLGSLQGEVVIRSDQLKKYATLLCLACCNATRQNSKITKQCMEILEKAGKYNILYKYNYAKEVNAQKSITISILTDLSRRHLEHRTDLLPIVANVCTYDVRLIAKEDGSKRHSLSMSILALYLTNRELLRNFHGADKLRHNVFSFLKQHSLRICAPLPDRNLTLIKHCRLSVLNLSLAGIHTKGVL